VAHGEKKPYITDKNVHPFFDGGLVLTTGKTSFSIIQKIMPPLLEGFSSHTVGTFAFTVSW
jgi:hypothetical protein